MKAEKPTDFSAFENNFPAVVCANGDKAWYLNGKLQRKLLADGKV